MKVQRKILEEMLTVNKDICVLINKMQRQRGHLDQPDMQKFNDLQLKMKHLAKFHPEEWTVFQSRDKQTNVIKELQ